MPRRSYTPTEIDICLLTLALTGRNSVEAARRLKDQGITINPRTLRSWREHTHADRYMQIVAEHAPAIERQMIGTAREIVLRANAATVEAIDAAAEQVRTGEAKDPSTVARNLATVAGIQTDKALLTEGRPTIIHGNDLEALMQRMSRFIGAIDSTAIEIEPSAELPEGEND